MTTYQPSLLDQVVNLKRVRGRIGGIVYAFCCARIGQQFHLRELEEYVSERRDGAPDSPSRILRDLRQSGLIDYEVVSRSQSLYRVTRAFGAAMTNSPVTASKVEVGQQSDGREMPMG